MSLFALPSASVLRLPRRLHLQPAGCGLMLLLCGTVATAEEVYWTHITGKLGWGQTVGPGDGLVGAPNNWTTTPLFPQPTDDVVFDNRASGDGVWIGGPGYGDLGKREVSSLIFRGSNPKRLMAWSDESGLTSSRRLDITNGLIVEADSGPVQMGDAVNASIGVLRVGVGIDSFIRNDAPVPLTFGSPDNLWGTHGSIYGQGLEAGYADQPGASIKLLEFGGSGTGGTVFNVAILDGSTNSNGSRPLGVKINQPNATVTYNVPNEYTGPTVVEAGTLALGTVTRDGVPVIGSIDSSASLTVADGGRFDATALTFGWQLPANQVVGGSGAIDVPSLSVEAFSVVAPTPGGPLSVSGDVTWWGLGTHEFQLADATAAPGWGLLDIGGSLTISATSFSPLNLDLETLSSGSSATPGPAAGFDPGQAYEWEFLRAAGGITGFAADAFQINVDPTTTSAGFANDLAGGSFSVAQAGNSLNLVFTPGSSPSAIVIDVPSGSATQAERGYPAIPTAESLTKTGGGTLIFDAANGYSGPTLVEAGTLQLATAEAAGNSQVTVRSGATLAIADGVVARSAGVVLEGGTLSASALSIDATTGLAAVTVAGGSLAGSPAVTVAAGSLSLRADARDTLTVASLDVDSDAGGRVDLGAGQVLIGPGGTTAAALRADIIAGRAAGGWDGAAGIVSSAAAAAPASTRGVGYVVRADGSATVSFAAPGDTTLDGVVNVFDLVEIESAGRYGTGQVADWADGDFNYDGLANVFDLVAVEAAGTYNSGSYFPASAAGLGQVAAVPEPAGLLAASAGLVAAGLLVRRRR